MARVTGKLIAKHNGLAVKHALYRKSGDWYHILKHFPAALLDAEGYIKFETTTSYSQFVADGYEAGVFENAKTNTLTIRGGISAHPDYKQFPGALLFPDELVNSAIVIEGATHKVTVNSYERSASARTICISKWGLSCRVCKVNFVKEYGEIGEGFIHVHHLVPISAIGKEYNLNAETDLRPVCPNCHAMLHRRDPPFSIEELQNLRRKVMLT